MTRSFILIIKALLLLCCMTTAVLADSLQRDVILVLDNSGSMKKNDPGFLTTQAVSGMINNFSGDTRASIIIFDQDVDLAVELDPVNDETRSHFLDSLKKINYQGKFTDSPAAVERAIYELKTNGRSNARKVVVFMTDGIVDTGKQEMDAIRTEWLRDDLALDAADNGIIIYSVAFTGNADLLLISSLARKTKGQYFRAEEAEDLEGVFLKINELIYKPEPEPVVVPEEPEPPKPPKPEAVVEPPPAPVVVEQPVTQPVVTPPPAPDQAEVKGEQDEQMMMFIGVIAAIVIAAVLIIVVVLKRRGAATQTETNNEYVPQAYLNDIHGLTDKPSYEVGKKATMIGRVAGSDTDNLNYLVVPQTTVGRRHALIEYKDFAYWIIDQDSVNGTFVNDEKIAEAHRLKHGDKVRLHKFEFEFVMPEMFDTGMTVFSSPDPTDAPASNPDLEKLFGAEDGAAKAAGTVAPVQFSEDVTTPPMTPASEDETVARSVPETEDETIARNVLDSEDETVASAKPVEPSQSEAPTEFNVPDDDEGISLDDFMDTMAIDSADVSPQAPVQQEEAEEDDEDDATLMMVPDDDRPSMEQADDEDATIRTEPEPEQPYAETMIFTADEEDVPDAADLKPDADAVYDATSIFEADSEAEDSDEGEEEEDSTLFDMEQALKGGIPESNDSAEPAEDQGQYAETMLFDSDEPPRVEDAPAEDAPPAEDNLSE